MATSAHEPFTLIGLPAEQRLAKFRRDVRAGLTAASKRLPCCYFYDRLGSLLFEAICELPEYYLTRAEESILRTHANEIVALLPPGADLIELGSGTAVKTRLLIDALLRRDQRLRYIPLDICRTVLEDSARDLMRSYPSLEVLAIAGEYREALAHLGATVSSSKFILWLGSNIGNFEPRQAARFLKHVRDTLGPKDRLLIGIDLRKDKHALEAAYDDPCGVTAAFNRNILVRINRELGGAFQPDAFRHRAVYDEQSGCVAMYLVSERDQKSTIESLELEVTLAAGEMIHTEDSYKYSVEEIDALAANAGLRLERRWLDDARRFSVNLLAPSPVG